MYHSITIGTKNTYTDWHLVPETRPLVVLPTLKLVTVDVPGRDGILDLSDAIRHYPVYNNRVGSWRFHVLNDIANWVTIHEQIANYIHGRTFRVVLEDDPGFYYEGKLAFNSWTSNSDGTWSDVEIGYNLYPYKLSVAISTDEAWLWDPFSFVNGRIYGTGMKNIPVQSTSYVTKNLKGDIGHMPISPKFIVQSTAGIDLKFVNPELGLNVEHKNLTTGSYEFPEVIYTEFSENNIPTIQYKKSTSNNNTDLLSIQYRMGML